MPETMKPLTDELILVTPERGADELGIKLFEIIVGIKRPAGKTVAELFDLMPPDDKVRVRRAGKLVHKIIVSAVEQGFADAPSRSAERVSEWRPIDDYAKSGAAIFVSWPGTKSRAVGRTGVWQEQRTLYCAGGGTEDLGPGFVCYYTGAALHADIDCYMPLPAPPAAALRGEQGEK